jgi:hypothetical protein
VLLMAGLTGVAGFSRLAAGVGKATFPVFVADGLENQSEKSPGESRRCTLSKGNLPTVAITRQSNQR